MFPVPEIEIPREYEFVNELFCIDSYEQLNQPDLVNLICESDNNIGINMSHDVESMNVANEIYIELSTLGDHETVIARSTLIQDGGTCVQIAGVDDGYWESLSEYVSIDCSIRSRLEYSELFSCTTPEAIVCVGPECYLPIFQLCIEGTCACQYKLCDTVCQLNPCRFAAAILAFKQDVTRDDLYVLTCTCRGVRIVDHDCTSTYYGENYSSITGKKFASEMTLKVKNELILGKVRVVKERPKCVHSLGGVSKSNGKLRPITDCSQPDNININEFMSTTCEKFHYKTVDNVVGMMHPLDHGAVTDISEAYRTIHVIPSHRKYQGFCWDTGAGVDYYEDLHLCFGLRCAPYCFTKFSDFIVKCCTKFGVKRCINYLDDFAVLGDSYESCWESQNILQRMCVNLGFRVEETKSTAPAQIFKYLGIVINSVEMTVSVDEDKLKRVQREVTYFLDKTSCRRDQLEEVAGLLAHCATVVKGGRTFARRIYNTLKNHHTQIVPLDVVIQQDFIWWASFVNWFNGKAKVLGADPCVVEMYSDSSNFGFGAYIDDSFYSDDYFWGSWHHKAPGCVHSENPPEEVYDSHINVTEMWPVVVGIHKWGERWKNQEILVVTDNTQVQAALNTGRSINPYTMAWLREIFWVSAFFNISIKAARISSVDNILADSLSRLDNPDCVTICASKLFSFSQCCRFGCAPWGVARCEGALLGRQYH